MRGNMDILYSPWRINYILSKKDKECIFCLKPQAAEDEKNFIVFRSQYCYVILNVYPYNNGHIMVVPNRHVSFLGDLEGKELNDLFETVQLSEKVLIKTYKPEGLNIGLNLGKSGGAGIEDHIHVHLVPRWQGDANYMSVVGGVRVIPESFEQAYKQIKEQFDNEKTKK
jgi:ATP adenylyltransferase